jgi:tRNA(Ile)-lysidine synthase
MDDETNEDLAIPRNRIRTEVLPRLAADFNPNVVEVLAREADVARDIWSWLERELERFGLDLHVDRLRAAPVALRRLALWRAMSDRGADHVITASHVDAALGLIDAREGATVDAPGIRVHRIGSLIVLTDRTENPGKNENPSNVWRLPLSIPGEVTAHDMTLSAELVPGGPAGLPPGAEVGTGLVAAVRADLLADGLAVRNRRAGDRFRPVGLNGRKKLQDFFVDRKIVRSQRDLVPVVVDDRDQIVWVAGHRIDEAFRVTDASQGMVVLKLRYLHPTVQEPRGGDPVERCS